MLKKRVMPCTSLLRFLASVKKRHILAGSVWSGHFLAVSLKPVVPTHPTRLSDYNPSKPSGSSTISAKGKPFSAGYRGSMRSYEKS